MPVLGREAFDVHYPTYIVDEFLLLLGNIFEGQTGPHIYKARQQFENLQMSISGRFRKGVSSRRGRQSY